MKRLWHKLKQLRRKYFRTPTERKIDKMTTEELIQVVNDEN